MKQNLKDRTVHLICYDKARNRADDKRSTKNSQAETAATIPVEL